MARQAKNAPMISYLKKSLVVDTRHILSLPLVAHFFFFLTLGIKFMIFNFPFDFILFLLFCGTVVKLYKKDAEVNKKKIWTKNKAIYIKITFYCIVFWDF
jgi:hypothetical protein